LTSSGNKHGSSNTLADEFIRGVAEAGHDVTEYDVFHADIRPCTGCNACGMSGPCDEHMIEKKQGIRLKRMPCPVVWDLSPAFS